MKYIITEEQFSRMNKSKINLEVFAKKISILFPKNLNRLQEFFNFLMDMKKNKSQFIGHINSTNIIKLTFLIFSYKTTGDFSLGNSMMSSLGFANLFATEGVPYEIECPECDGTERQTCGDCRGSGDVTCDDCSGNGMDDEGYSCHNCGGSGESTCNNCGGAGDVSCHVCEGDGYVETNEISYEYYGICTWSNYLKDKCELREGSYEPILTFDNFIDLNEDYIILDLENKHQEFNNQIQKDEMYCTYYSDNPMFEKTISLTRPSIIISKSFNDLEPYLL